MIVADKFTNTTNAPSKLKARVELYNGSTLLNNYSEDDYLQGINIERVGEESKFFGFSVCHKITVTLGDYEKNVDATGANLLKVAYGVDSDFIYPYPLCNITEIVRDEASREITITAYDPLTTAAELTTAELELPEGELTLRDYAVACAGLLGLAFKVEGVQDNCFELSCVPAPNLEGTESVRDLLNDIAEATQTICFINYNGELVFKRLDAGGAPVATIDHNNSMNIVIGETYKLTGITHATELGDNVNANTGEDGVTQYVRDNAFWELRDDIASILDIALANVSGGGDPTQSAKLGVALLGSAKLGAQQQQGGGITNTVFSADWFGNCLLEVGDKISIEDEDGALFYSYVLNDVVSYTGIVLEQTQWIYSKSDGEHENSNKLGEAIKQTFAKVDKANKRIDLVVSERDADREQLTQIQQTTDDVNIAVKRIETDGVNKVETATGYKFDAGGLTISKSGSEMTTQITEDGMAVYRGNTEMLTANHEGVKATDLHARTYLIIGGNSRFEDYENTRTACFWIGG